MSIYKNKFEIPNRVCVITGGAGLLGRQHAEALTEIGGITLLLDKDLMSATEVAKSISEKCIAIETDVSDVNSIKQAASIILEEYGRIDVLVNNAAIDTKVSGTGLAHSVNFEQFSIEQWYSELSVGLTGSFLCSQVFGTQMCLQENGGVILNISSDLSVIAPDQRIYQSNFKETETHAVKPVTYSVIKTGLIGLTRYLATYWATNGVRVNALSPGGVYSNQSDEFIQKVSNLIPMGRLAMVDEYRCAVQFLCSDASSYMTGQNIVIDGGRSVW